MHFYCSLKLNWKDINWRWSREIDEQILEDCPKNMTKYNENSVTKHEQKDRQHRD